MKNPFRFVVRAVLLLVAASLLGFGGFLAWFSSWRTEKLARLEAASTVANSPSGKIEFVQAGDGPSVLVFHGAPGGFDQAMLYGSALADAGFHVVAPSRPGYLRTPLATGLTPEDQADAMLALVDSLGIGSVALVGVSLGAPAAIEFARRHPDRAWALVLVSAVTKKLPPDPMLPPVPDVLNRRLTGDIGSWVLVDAADRDPAKTLGWAFDLAQSGDATAREVWVRAVLGNSAQIDWFRDLVGTVAPLGPREDGLRNDLLQLRALAAVPYEKLAVPTLFVHGADDNWISLADIEAAEKRMPDAELLAVPGTGHFVELGPESASVPEKIVDFLNRFHGGQGTP